MQANGAEMLRLACCLATERGIEVCAPVHDAVLICAPLDRLEAETRRMQEAMAEASRAVLGGFELRSHAEFIRYPDRYMDGRGAVMWRRVWRLDRGGRTEGSLRMKEGDKFDPFDLDNLVVEPAPKAAPKSARKPPRKMISFACRCP